MRLWKKRQKRIVLEGLKGVAARAMLAENRHFPVIETKFDISRTRDETDVSDPELRDVKEVVVYLDLHEASEYAQSLLNAIAAATPQLPRMPYQSPFGGGGGI